MSNSNVQYAIEKFIDHPCKVQICRKIQSYLYIRRIPNTLSILYNSYDGMLSCQEGILKSRISI